MSYGFSLLNLDGRLLVSQDAFNLHYVGQATAVGQVPANAMATYYDITLSQHADVVIPFIRLNDGNAYRASHSYTTQTGPNTWRFTIHADRFDGVRATPQVHVFSRIAAGIGPLNTYGLRIMDAAGRTVFDSTRSPLGMSGRLKYPGWVGAINTNVQTSVALPSGISILGVGGTVGSWRDTYSGGGFGTYAMYYGNWHIFGSDLVRSQDMLVESGPEDLGSTSFNRSFAANGTALVIDLARYL